VTTKKRVYIAGPISKGDLEHNIKQSDEAFKTLTKAGFAPMNPMWSCFSGSVQRRANPVTNEPQIIAVGTQTGGLDLKHADWLGADLAWVEVSDAVLRLPGESTGADMETAHAKKKGIPVFDSVAKVIEHFEPVYTMYTRTGCKVAIGGQGIIFCSPASQTVLLEGKKVRMIPDSGDPGVTVRIGSTWRGRAIDVPASVLARCSTPGNREYREWIANQRQTFGWFAETDVVRLVNYTRIA
jgi:hypothetical protein